jgi:surface protein
MKYQPKLLFVVPLTLILFSIFSHSTIFEDGEDNSTKRWSVYERERLYDENLTDNVIENIFNEEKASQVIHFKGKDISYTYLIGAKEGAEAWKSQKPLLSWSMKVKKLYQLTLFVQTTKGLQHLYFSYNSSRNTSHKKTAKSSPYIHINLPKPNKKGDWQHFSFDLKSIIEQHDSKNQLLSVNGLTVQGQGYIDDIQLRTNDTAFVSTWKIDHRKTLRISTNSRYNYNFKINWGDGSTDSNISETITHHYETSGEYSVSITGIYPHPYKLCSKEQNLIGINQWGTQKWTSMKEAFKNCKNFKTINDPKSPNLSNVKDMYRMFYNAEQFNQNISQWNVSSVKDMNSMFYNARQFNQDIGDWNVSLVEDMQFMFKLAKSFNQDIGDWNVSSVKRMRKIFYKATSFNRDISRWNTSSVKDHTTLNKKNIIPENVSVVTNIRNELELINGVNENP